MEKHTLTDADRTVSQTFTQYQNNSQILTVKEMDVDDQPREKLKKYGVSSLTNAELFAIILRTGVRGYPITTLCRDLMKANDNLFLNLERKSIEEIISINGIGETKAMQIEAVMEIVRRYSREKIGDRICIRTSRDIYEMMKPEIANLPHEEMWVVFLDQRNAVIGKYKASEGGHAATVFDAKKILRQAILARSQAIILCHNHPSGNLRTSPQDDMITRKLKSACEALELRMLDHIVVTTEGFYSYADSSTIMN